MRNVLLVGATGGFGLAIAELLAQTGRYRAFAAGTNPERLQQLGKMKHVFPVSMNLLDEDSVAAAFEQVTARTQSLYAILHFAGVSGFQAVSEGDPLPEVRRQLDINLLGAVQVNTRFLPLVEAQKGRIIHCTSEVGWMTAQPFAGPYCLSKRALEAYNDSLRRELMFRGVRVVKIQPGAIRTGMTEDILSGFDRTLANTRHYNRLLTKMRPLMLKELSGTKTAQDLARLTLRVLDANHPRIKYRIATGKPLMLMELLPEGLIDRIYRFMGQ